MAEKPKSRRAETPAQKSTFKTKTPPTAPKRTAPCAPSSDTSSNANTADAPKGREPAKCVTAEERWNMIADAAYYRAEKRHFVGGDPAEDWAAAEAEIEAALAGRHT